MNLSGAVQVYLALSLTHTHTQAYRNSGAVSWPGRWPANLLGRDLDRPDRLEDRWLVRLLLLHTNDTNVWLRRVCFLYCMYF